MLIAMVNFLIGSLLLATVPLNQSYWLQTFFSIIIMPGAMNLSFPVATILISSSLPKEKQGIAASLVSTMVNYSISCGLGLAGTIHRFSFERAIGRPGEERETLNGSPLQRPHGRPPLLSESTPFLTQVRLRSFRGPWWFAVGMSGFGVVIAGVFILWNRRKAVPK
jgi:MFS family permease